MRCRMTLFVKAALFFVTVPLVLFGQQFVNNEIPSREDRSPDIFLSYIKSGNGNSIHRDPNGLFRSINQMPEDVRKSMTYASGRHESGPMLKAMTTFVVSDASDAPDSDINDGLYSPPTLRSALENANKLGGTHAIVFSPSVTLIQPATALPSIDFVLSIDGSIAGEKVILDGSVSTGGYGLLTYKSITVKNIIFRSWSSVGLGLGFNSHNSVIQRNEFTLNKTGLNINSNNNLVGGDDPSDRNFAYGNTQDGIVILYGNDNIVRNNFCGTKDGMTASPNTSAGMYILGERTQVKNNVISGNSDDGLEIGEFSVETLVQENLIGVDSTGNGKLPNTNDGIATFAERDSIIFNIISGNGYGMTVLGQASNTYFHGNIVGPNKSMDSLYGNRYGGLYVIGADATIDSNIISSNKGAGITLTGFGGAVVTRNRIGTDPAGTLDWGNTGPGMNIYCDRNIIGGDDPADRNIISGNGGGGIEMFGGIVFAIPGPNYPNYVQGNRIENNILGADITGTQRLSNYTGLFMNGYVDSNFVRNNLISGNMNHGIWTRRSPSAPSRNTFQSNKIGTQVDGITPLPNDSTAFMIDSAAVNLFGGPNEADGNIVAFSNQSGLTIKAGWGFAIQRNSIFKNKGLAIDLGNDGPSPNDSSDADLGPNRLQNYPRITWIGRTGGTTVVKGHLQSRANTTFRLEFYTNDEADTTGFGEGQTFQKTVDVVTDTAGRAPFEVTIDGAFARVVGTATDPEFGTSEFSKAPFVVNSVADRSDADPFDGLASTSGPQVNGIPEVTLRSAIQASNRIAGEDDVAFDIPGSPPFFIIPASPLTNITGDISIDGSTQPGYNPESQHAIQILGTGAGNGVNGLTASADRATFRALYLAQFNGNGIEASGDLLTLVDVTSNSNKQSGIRSTADVTLEGTSVFNGNGPGSGTSSLCNTIHHAGLWVEGWIRGKGSVTAMSNCGVGIRHNGSIALDESGINLNASVTASQNSAGGLFAEGNVWLKGEQFDFSNNGNSTILARGIHLGAGNLVIEATGAGEFPVIKANNNSFDGVFTAIGSLTLKGKSQFNNNGASRPRIERLNNMISGIKTEASIFSQSIEVSGNGFDGIRTHKSLYVDGDLTVKNHPARGVWATFHIGIDGSQHLIENNGDQAMWAANGWIEVKGTLTVRNNKYGGTFGTDDGPYEDDARIGAVQAWKNIIAENVILENNEPSGMAGWDNVWIKGNAVATGNKVDGIFAMDELRIDGTDNTISNNGGNGLATNNRGILVGGTIVLDGNGKNGEVTEDGQSGYGAIGQYVQMPDVTARGNTQSGLLGFSGVVIRGQGVIGGNQKNGIESRTFVNIAGGRVYNNIGYGISSPLVKISGTQIVSNGAGGIAGKVVPNSLSAKSAVQQTMTGYTAPGQRSIVKGSAILNNGGDGLLIDSEFPLTVHRSNISGNAGFGINNDGPGPVFAENNWWGNAAGPGSSVNGTVQASTWQSASIPLFAGATDDSVFVLPGVTDILPMVAARWNQENDSMTVSASDSKGWLQSVSNLVVTQLDSVPAIISANYTIPPEAVPGDTSMIVVHAQSIVSPGITAQDTFYFVVYAPSLVKLDILKDTLRILPGDTVVFTAYGFDQNGNEMLFSPLWSAGGGTISDSGLYVAGNDTGSFFVHVSDTVAGVHDSVAVIISSPVVTNLPALISVSAESIDGGTVPPGEISASQFYITNPSEVLLSVDSLRTHTPHFSAVRVPDVPLVPFGDTLIVAVTFSPDTTRLFTDTLYIYYNSPLAPKKIVLTGNGSTTGIGTDRDLIPDRYVLDQNYPNPFNPSTTIRFGVPVASKVTVRIFDILGREVYRLADGIYQPGYVSVVWSARVASGLYLYRIESNSINDPSQSFVQTRKMLLIR
ncbi:MAG: T9SS type A sorting domain-containing protein [Bacteroidota bacterium]